MSRLDIGRIPSGRKPLPEWPFKYVFEFPSLATGTQRTVNQAIDAGTDFVCEMLLAGAYFDSTASFVSRSNIVGIDTTAGNDNTGQFVQEALAVRAKLAREASNNLAWQSNAALGHLFLSIMLNDRPWQSGPCRLDLVTGEPGKLLFEIKPIVLPANSTVQMTMYNVLPANVGGITTPPVDVSVVMVGYKVAQSAVPIK